MNSNMSSAGELYHRKEMRKNNNEANGLNIQNTQYFID